VLWLVPGLALTKSKINSGELTDKYQLLV